MQIYNFILYRKRYFKKSDSCSSIAAYRKQKIPYPISGIFIIFAVGIDQQWLICHLWCLNYEIC